jgi:hypothetical protein
MNYQRVSDASHVLSTEEALKHWDRRRPSTSHSSLELRNVSQMSARNDAMMRAVIWMETRGLNVNTDHLLDVGASTGYGLWQFLQSGFPIAHLHGIDLFEDRVSEGLARTPGLDLRLGDATAMPYKHGEFKLVCEQFCFCHIPDDSAKVKIAAEMMRVSSKFILLQDWRLGSESRKLYGLPPRRISEWFPGWHTTRRFRSQLWPAIGRPLSLHAPLLHDLVRVVNPLVGAWITVLEKS